MKRDTYLRKIGELIAITRQRKGVTQAQLAEELGTSQSAVHRMENGGQNISMEMIARISEVLGSDVMMLNDSGKTNFRVHGGQKTHR